MTSKERMKLSCIHSRRFLSSGSIAENRRAHYDYSIKSVIEAGLILTGSEVKSLRLGLCTITECYAGPKGDELYLFNVYIPEYQGTTHQRFGHETRRPRKLLLHRREIEKLRGGITRSGMSLIPLCIYFSPRGNIKIRLGLARGKRLSDKRESEKKRDWQREKSRLMRGEKI